MGSHAFLSWASTRDISAFVECLMSILSTVSQLYVIHAITMNLCSSRCSKCRNAQIPRFQNLLADASKGRSSHFVLFEKLHKRCVLLHMNVTTAPFQGSRMSFLSTTSQFYVMPCANIDRNNFTSERIGSKSKALPR